MSLGLVRHAGAHHVAEVAHGAPDQRRHVDDALETRGHGVADELPLVGDVLRLVRLRRFDLGALRAEVVQRGHDLGAAGTVDRRVVHLGDDTDAVLLEPLDHPDLPERFAAVQGHRCDAGGHICQLSSSSWFRCVDAVDVEVEVEVGVLDPNGVVEVERHGHQATPEGGNQVHALCDEPADGVEGVPAGHGVGVEDRRHGHVHVGIGGLEVGECGVDPRQAFHVVGPL